MFPVTVMATTGCLKEFLWYTKSVGLLGSKRRFLAYHSELWSVCQECHKNCPTQPKYVRKTRRTARIHLTKTTCARQP